MNSLTFSDFITRKPIDVFSVYSLNVTLLFRPEYVEMVSVTLLS